METFPSTARLCSGTLLFFDDGKTILLGREFRPRYNTHNWMEFGGKQEENETLAETACRETNEETAQTLNITIQQVLFAQDNGHYVDHYNDKTNIFYRMYLLKIDGEKPTPETFKENAKGKDHVEKEEWKYFNTFDIMNSVDGNLPETEAKLYATMLVRLEKLRDKQFFKVW